MPVIDKKYYHNIDLANNELKAGRIYNLTGNYINNYLNLTAADTGYIVYNTTDYKLQFWDGSGWQILLSGLAAGTVTSVSAGTGMSFTTITTTGSISIDITKVPYLASGFSTGFLKWNGSAWIFDNNSYLANFMSTNKLIGRTSSGNGVMEEISLGTGLSFSGTTLNNTATFTSPLTTKGDIYVRNSSVDTRLPIGLDTQILIADSTATTGMKWGSNTAATPTGYYGAWQDNITQTAAVNNTGYAMIFRTIDISNGVTVVTNGTNLTRITFANTGVYNLQFSSQFQNIHNVDEDVTIWLRKNGTDVTGSSGFISVPSSHGGTPGHIIAGWNYLLNVIAGEYYELIWSTTDAANVTMQFYAAGSPPPSAASVILTVTQQSGIMAGTGITAINSLTGSVQTMVSGTSGTDFAISSTGSTHTFNLPTASSINTGKLSSADWSIFNNKQNALTNPITGTGTNNELAYFNTTGSTLSSLSTTTYPSLTELSYVKGVTSSIQTQLNSKQESLTLTTTGTSGAATLVGNTLNIPQYSGGGGMAIGGSITSATAGSILFADTSGVLAQDNTNFFWDNTNKRLGIGTASPTTRLDVRGAFNFTNTGALTNTTQDVGTYLISSSATTAAGFGQRILLQGKVNTSDNQPFGYITSYIRSFTSLPSSWGTSLNIGVQEGGSYVNVLNIGGNSSGLLTVTSNITLSGGNFYASSNSLSHATQVIGGFNNGTNSAINYATTNGGSLFAAQGVFGLATVSAGNISVRLHNTNGVVFTAGNGASHIARAAIQITNLTNTAGSESGDLIFLTQSGGTVISEKWRITSTGLLGNNTTSITSALQINKNQNSVTQADANGILLANSTAATVGLQSISPAIVWQGNGWQIATAGSQDVRFRADVLPVQGTTNPTATWQLVSSVNNAAYSNSLTYTSGGVLTVSNVIQTGGGTGVIAAGSQLIGGLTSTAAKFFRLTSPSGTSVTPVFGVGAGFGSGATGVVSMAFDATYHITLLAGNASLLNTPRASIQITNLTNTAGSESGDLIFLTQSGGTAISEKMRIFAGGNVGIGTGNSNSGYKFDVNGTGRFQNVLTTTGRVHANSRKTSAYTLTILDKIIFADLATAAFTVTLPNHVAGTEYTIIKSDSTSNLLTVNTTSGLISGNPTWTTSAQYKFITVVSDGSNWLIVAGG